MNKLYLFYPDSLLGKIITFITKCPYSHSAVEVDGVLYDSSESRGDFNISHINPSDREHKVYEFEGDLSEWVLFMSNSVYDWKGVIGWLFNWNTVNKFYCFEASWMALHFAGIVEGQQPSKLSGCALERLVV